MAEQHEGMKEIVAALQDSDKGKSASLASLLAQHQERYPADLLTTKSEVRAFASRSQLPNDFRAHFDKGICVDCQSGGDAFSNLNRKYCKLHEGTAYLIGSSADLESKDL